MVICSHGSFLSSVLLRNQEWDFVPQDLEGIFQPIFIFLNDTVSL
jgi:hypothetical protein